MSSSYSAPVIGHSGSLITDLSGPWFAEKSSSDYWYITDAPEPFSRAIGQTWGFDTPGDDQEARARLLAAAPEMLAALVLAEDVLARFPFSSEIWPNGTHPNTGIAQIRAAIAKAYGR